MMARDQRRDIIKAIEDERQTRVICYITGDRRGLETKIASDIFPILYHHLLDFKQVEPIDLYIYTIGGDSIAGWGLVNLIREFSKTLNVIIPFKSLSCGTLIALGANSIVMGKGAQLSPIDPSVASPYNPQAPGAQPGRAMLLPVSVEDMIGYLDLVRDEAGIKEEDNMVRVIEKLSDKVHPMALGAVYRAREQTKTLATRLLESHLSDKARVEKIVDTLTKELPTHHYLIGRKEAKTLLGTLIAKCSKKLEDHCWQLYQEYEELLELTTPYNPEAILGSSGTATGTFYRGVVESLSSSKHQLKTHVFITDKELKRIQTTQPGVPIPITAVQERITNEGWREETNK